LRDVLRLASPALVDHEAVDLRSSVKLAASFGELLETEFQPFY
jgi:hypothetical protein